MTPDQFWRSTWGEIVRFVQGYWDRLRTQRSMVEVLYHSCSWATKRPSILDLIPIPDDPDEEERKEIEKRAAEQEAEGYRRMFSDIRNLGLN